MENEILQSIGKNIRKYRELRGLTREQLAEILDIDTGYLGQCERGEAQLGIAKTVNVIEYFGVSANEIIVIPNGSSHQNREKYINEILEVLKDCTDNQLAVILKSIEALAPFLKE